MSKIKVVISKELIAEWFTEGHGIGGAICTKGLPEGSVLVNAAINGFGDLLLTFQGPSEFVINPVFESKSA